MSEVATVAAILGGVTSTGITGLVTWRVSKNSSSVELVKVAAENHRLRYDDREEERRNRQSTYHQFLDVLTLLFQILGSETDTVRRREIGDRYNHLFSGVILFGPPKVRKGAIDLHAVYQKIWKELDREESENPDKTDPERWRDATAGLKNQFSTRFRDMVDLMHEDVTQGIA
jgi:hypothetical protein